jgi:hypothetical protein
MGRVRRVLFALLFWVVGFACALGYVATSGGWYVYRLVDAEIAQDIATGNRANWEPPPNVERFGERLWVRRSRFRLGT